MTFVAVDDGLLLSQCEVCSRPCLDSEKPSCKLLVLLKNRNLVMVISSELLTFSKLSDFRMKSTWRSEEPGEIRGNLENMEASILYVILLLMVELYPFHPGASYFRIKQQQAIVRSANFLKSCRSRVSELLELGNFMTDAVITSASSIAAILDDI